jgi:hypothetical protein
MIMHSSADHRSVSTSPMGVFIKHASKASDGF